MSEPSKTPIQMSVSLTDSQLEKLVRDALSRLPVQSQLDIMKDVIKLAPEEKSSEKDFEKRVRIMVITIAVVGMLVISGMIVLLKG